MQGQENGVCHGPVVAVGEEEQLSRLSGRLGLTCATTRLSKRFIIVEVRATGWVIKACYFIFLGIGFQLPS